MIKTGENIDWATAESLAFATLLNEGYPVRLVGQDSVKVHLVRGMLELRTN